VFHKQIVKHERGQDYERVSELFPSDIPAQ
jgi:hypothetical protein